MSDTSPIDTNIYARNSMTSPTEASGSMTLENEKTDAVVSENDVDELKHISGDAALIKSDGLVRRLQIPSSDPNDPLNWDENQNGG